MKGRYIPLPVRQALRKEARFGCVVCGHPILDYHHIIPWAEKQHNEPEHMVAVCPTHHRDIGKRTRQYAYDLKSHPHNLDVAKFNGELATNKTQPSFVLGTNTFIETPTIFTFYDQPILRYRVENNQSLFSAYIPRADYWPEIEIVDNDIVANIDDFWDIEFSTNIVRFRRAKGKSFFVVDLRNEHAEVEANLTIGGHEFSFSATTSSFANTMISHSTISRCSSGLAFGSPNTRLLRPNYAMRNPKAQFVFK